jgi:DNA invertase Pin-like site-specific DNA recombinase
MKTGVSWFRVSSVGQVGGYSLDAQEEQIFKFAEREKIELVKKYRVQESAKESHRRKYFKEMVEFVKTQKVEYLLSFDVDRIARNYEDFFTIHKLIDEYGVNVAIVCENKIYNKNSPPSERFFFQMMGSYAEMENRKRSEKTKLGLQRKISRGELPSYAPVGYLNVPHPADKDLPENLKKRKTIIVDPEREHLVRQMFELYGRGGWSLARLRDEMERRGLRRRNGKPLSINGVGVVLRKPFYIGKMKNGMIGVHQPIIPLKLFERVQNQLFLAHRETRPNAKKFFAFKRFLRCYRCHGSVTGELHRGRHGKGHFVYYQCVAAKKGKCSLKTAYREKDIDAVFQKNVSGLYVDPEIADKIREELRSGHIKQSLAVKTDLRRLNSEKTKNTNKLNTLMEEHLEKKITIEEMREWEPKLKERNQRIDEEIRELDKRNFAYVEQGLTVLQLLKNFDDTYARANLEDKSRILDAVLQTCIVGGEEPIFNFRPPFNFLFTISQIMKMEQKGFELQGGRGGKRCNSAHFLDWLKHNDFGSQIEQGSGAFAAA